MERLRRYWFTGSCNNLAGKEKQSRSDPLALEQFFSTFLLLLLGMAFAGVLLLAENVYLKYALKRQRRLGLVSLPWPSSARRVLGPTPAPAGWALLQATGQLQPYTFPSLSPDEIERLP